jgi:predicted DNA repair protein MutK
MSLYYQHLSLEATEKLYEVFIRRTAEEQKNSQITEFKIKRKEIMRFAKSHFKRLEKDGLSTWNGRYTDSLLRSLICP